MYPSRSELIRAAVRDFILKESKAAKYNLEEQEIDDFDDENYVKIPIETKNEYDEPITEIRTFKILREA